MLKTATGALSSGRAAVVLTVWLAGTPAAIAQGAGSGDPGVGDGTGSGSPATAPGEPDTTPVPGAGPGDAPGPQGTPEATRDAGAITPPTTAAAPGAIAGQVLRAGSAERPVGGATVTVEDGAGGLRRIEADARGRFRVDDLVAGTYAVTALGEAGEQADLRVDVVAGRTAQVTLRLAATAASETIVVRGLSEASRRRQSADAVTVVDTERAKRETSDLGDVLGRTQGVGVRRGGGLGSTARLSLGGLAGDQVRFFLDGVPLELVGYPFGIANVPVNLVDRIEIYSGVVPIRLGADALGGAINLVTDQNVTGTHGGLSYEVGSFDTDRVTLSGRHLHAPSGVFARVDGFFDHARNDYPVDVEVPDAMGQLSPVRVHLFHDGYVAAGGAGELGVIDRPWARRLAVRGFASGFDKEYQHNLAMNRVYGAVTYGERSAGASVRYEQPLGHGVSLDAVSGYAFTRGVFRDVSPCSYDWFGRCQMDGSAGEIDSLPHDELSWEHAAFARLHVGWTVQPRHALRLTVAPTYTARSGNERSTRVTGRDPLSAQRDLVTVVNGLEYQTDLLGDRLENIVFVKHYYQRQASEDPQPGGAFLRADRHTQRAGVGNGLRYRFTDWLYAKASYEWATRLPRASEVFGDNAFITPSLALEPETSHNLNLGATVDGVRTPAGVFGATATGFLREAAHLIDVFGSNNDQSYQNVFGARSIGVELAADWTSPGGHLALDGNATYQDFRNTSSEGQFGSFEGDRIPNHPYLFGSGSARFKLRDLVVPRDEVVVSVGSRYVHRFFRGWESVGRRDQKQVIPSQLIHSLSVNYLVHGDRVGLSTILEVSNLTDADAVDFFGVQRPGRAFYVKTALEF